MKWFLRTLSLTAIALVFVSLILGGGPHDLKSFVIVLTLFGVFWGIPLFVVIGVFVWWLG
jgi:hypothetical protein